MSGPESGERKRSDHEEALLELVEQLKKSNADLRRRIAELEKELQEAMRASKRQAAPFGKGKGKEKAKKPGRKRGHRGSRRRPPAEVDRTLVAPRLDQCPCCSNGELRDHREHENFETDIPPVTPINTRFRFWSAYCPTCNRRVLSTHPEQTSTATGAAASPLGPRLRAFAGELKA